jgi:hypothetical protein
MLSDTLSLTEIMTYVNKLPPQSRLRLVQLTLDTLIIKSTNEAESVKEIGRFNRFRGIATEKLSTDEIMSLTRGE